MSYHKKVLSVLVILVMVTASLAGCASNKQQDNTPETIVMKVASEGAVGTPGEKSAKDFAELVKEKSNGRIDVKYYPAGQLGTGDKMTEALQNGSVDVVWRVADWYTKFENGWNILLMGFMFEDAKQVEAFIKSPKQQEFKENLIRKGIRILADNGIGAPRVLISKKPVKTPEDMKAMKMRVPNIEMYLKVWTGVGVNVVQVPWGESYMALKQGVVDALESPLGSVYGMKFQEAAKYITMTNHIFPVYFMAMNENYYQKLPADLQKIVSDAAVEAGELYNKYEAESLDDTKKKLVEAGAILIEDPDLAAFKEKLSPLAGELEANGILPKGLYQYVVDLNKK